MPAASEELRATLAGSSTPCRTYGTEMMHVWTQVPGDIIRG
ncbi:hypothetical protein [Dactylosporangium sp. NPDC000521]